MLHNIPPLITAQEIEKAVSNLAGLLNIRFAQQDVIILSVLKGAFLFTADLVRHLAFNHEIHFMEIKSYSGTSKLKTQEIQIDIHFNPENKHILVLEDIVDSGQTILHLKNMLLLKKAASITVASLLLKKDTTSCLPDYHCFEADAGFIIGYGMDYNEKYRNLPYLALMESGMFEQ